MNNTLLTTPKKVNYVTDEGFIVDIATDSVIGFKCQMCSTAHVLLEADYNNDPASIILMWKETHESCGF